MVYVVVVLLTCCAKGTNYERDDLLLTNMTILCATCVCRNQLVLEKIMVFEESTGIVIMNINDAVRAIQIKI